MTKKQKRTLLRILIAGALFAALFVGERLGWLDRLNGLLAGGSAASQGLPGTAAEASVRGLFGLPWLTVGLCLYLAVYLLIGWDVVWKALRNLVHGQVFDENFLMLIATVAAFCIGEYEEAVAVMLFYQIGELFQSYAVGKSRRSISALMDIAPEFANVEQDGRLVQVEPDEVEIGTVVTVLPYERVPIDGVVLEGESLLDTAALTGESVPRKVGPGSEILSGCINGSAALKVRTSKEYDDSTVARILELVENASSRKAQVENFITRFARWYTPIVTVAALLLALIPPLFVGGWGDWIRRGCIFLVISCPCALVISVPLGFFGGIGAASRLGVLVKGSNYLETAARLDTVVFDKTGTLTRGEFAVSRVEPVGMDAAALLELAALGEGYSDHPIAASIRKAWAREERREKREEKMCFPNHDLENEMDLSRVGEAEAIPGRGVRARIDGHVVLLGNRQLLVEQGVGFDRVESGKWTVESDGTGETDCHTSAAALVRNDRTEDAAADGGTVVYVARDGVYCGRIVIEDRIKDGAREAIAGLRQAGVRRCVMLTGDRQAAAETVAKALGVDEFHAELLPGEKVDLVESMMNQAPAGAAEKGPMRAYVRDSASSAPTGCGKERPSGDGPIRGSAPSGTACSGVLAFVGDGINDAPVLVRADLGVAMGAMGSDAAIEAADVVIMDDGLEKLPRFVRLARKTLRIVRQNIVFALTVKLGILLLGALGLANLWLAVFADVGVAVLAILNAMRTLRMK